MIEAIETLHAITTGHLQRGSVARIRDCCNKGGILSDCIKSLGGICTYDDYPTVRGNCEPNACQPFTSVCFRILMIFKFLQTIYT